MKRKLIKVAASALAMAMLAGAASCSAAQNDMRKISIGSVGKVRFTLADYMESYNNYAPYAQYMPDLNETVKTQLINYGATLNECYNRNLTLDEAEEQELKNDVEKKFKEAVEEMSVSEGIEGDEAIYAAKLEAFKKQMKENGFNEGSYKKYIEENLRKSKLIEKLREQTNNEVSFGKEQVKEYFDEHVKSDEEKYKNDASAFAQAYTQYMNDSGYMPLYTPEDMFTVKQVLVQYENAADVTDSVEGVFNDDINKKLDDIRKALNDGISLDDFVKNYMSNKDYNDDTVFVPAEPSEDGTEVEENQGTLNYREHGYIMNEKILSNYFEGFGAAACMLKYGEDWTEPTPEPSATPAPDSDMTAEPDADATTAPESTEPTADATTAPESAEPETTEQPTATPEPEEVDLIKKYSIKFYETSDGHKIAEAKSPVQNGGIHFIFINDELESGAKTLDENNENDPVYANIAKFYREELESKHYNEAVEGWVKNTSIKLKDTYIDNFAKTYLGLKG